MKGNPIGQTLLNQFRIDAFVAAGGMGAVYRVWDLKRNVPLAMKVLHADLADDPSVFKRFQRETNALKKLAHPNIVPFYGLYKSEGQAFLLERFVDGPSLKDALRERGDRPMAVKEALVYLKALSAALGYAHAHGVVHCDVKPGNVMIDQGGSIYLTDFGVARHAESTTTTLAVAGTAAYMAPEQIRGEPVSPATDVYALGVILFEMLTGRRPFRGDEASTLSADSTGGERIRHAQLNVPPPDPRQFNPAIPAALARVILKALAKKPLERYQGTQEVFQAVYAALGVDSAQIPDRIALHEQRAKGIEPIIPSPPPGRGYEAIPHPGSRGRTPSWVWIVAGVVIVAILFLRFSILRPPLNIVVPLSSLTPVVHNATPGLTSIEAVITGTFTPAPTPTRRPPSPTPTEVPPTMTPTIPVLTWEQGRLTFVKKHIDGRNLYLMDISTGAEPLPIVEPSTNQLLMGPIWSPDGSLIAVYNVYNHKLYIIEPSPNADPRDLGECTQPSWSPDGSQILCKVGDRLQIIEVSSGARSSGPSIGGIALPVWSPIGDEIIYALFSGNATSLWVSGLFGGQAKQLAGEAFENYGPAWSHDGQWIAYQSTLGSDQSEVWVMDRNGQNARRITYSPAGTWSRGPSWSPDDRWLVFVSSQNGSAGADYEEVFIVSVDGGEPIQITYTGGMVYDWRVYWGK